MLSFKSLPPEKQAAQPADTHQTGTSQPGSNQPATPPGAAAPARAADHHRLDEITGGAFSAPTSGERAARVRAWLASGPEEGLIQEVFRELGAKDKGAVKPLREKLDELRRAKGQEAIAADWAARAQALLELPRLNIADALAWQRDAARAGAPLSREPLAGVKSALAERVKRIEDLQHRAQVQREASVLIAQRTEVLSTKPWRDAQAAWDLLRADVAHWQQQADALLADADWPSVDPRFTPQLESARAQLLVVWDAFQAALSMAVAAADDPTAPLPAVPVWADELNLARGLAAEAAAEKTPKPRVDPAVLKEMRAAATAAVEQALQKLEQALAEGQGKAVPRYGAELRAALKEHARLLDSAVEGRAHALLAQAGELEGWQRWRADQIREDLIARAVALATKPLGGRKQQEALRTLREQWKQTDQGGASNHTLWKRFDDACTEAHKVVEAWLEKMRAEEHTHLAQRHALIDELKAWTAAQVDAAAATPDWKLVNRQLHEFSERWRNAGHVSEKHFDQLQPLWKEAIGAAHAPLEAAQKASFARREALIAQAAQLGAAPMLNIAAVKALQQQWQAEAQSVPLDRKHEQRLWDAFRKPIDDAFARKSAEREKAAAALSEHDRRVLDASRALDEANASGDAQRIRAAMSALDAAVRGQSAAAARMAAQPPAEQTQPVQAAPADASAGVSASANASLASIASTDSTDSATAAEPGATDETPAPVAAAAAPAAPAAPKIIKAVRGDDRHGARKPEADTRKGFGKPGGKFPARPGERRDAPGGGRDGARDGGRDGHRRADFGRADFEPRGPRLSDAAYRAQRDALERAEQQLRKLSATAHGEAVSGLLAAWESRSADAVPDARTLGGKLGTAQRASWAQAIGGAPAPADAVAESMLRLEMASDAPTPAEHIPARRALQLKMLTRRNDPSPEQTWHQDVARVLSSAHDAATARRLQTVLKVLLRK